MSATEDHLDIYVPGVSRCPKCNFELTSQTIFMQSGDIGLTREQAFGENLEPCPNDGTPMVKVRWSERAKDNYEAFVALMNEIIGIARLSVQCDNLPAALDALRSVSSKLSVCEAALRDLKEQNQNQNQSLVDSVPGSEHGDLPQRPTE